MLTGMPGIGHWELIALAVIVVLLFGSKQVPMIGRSLGRGMREFKQTVGLVDPREDVRRAMEAPEDESRIASDRDDGESKSA
jgi:sec-independent protein translocase protein TatA